MSDHDVADGDQPKLTPDPTPDHPPGDTGDLWQTHPPTHEPAWPDGSNTDGAPSTTDPWPAVGAAPPVVAVSSGRRRQRTRILVVAAVAVVVAGTAIGTVLATSGGGTTGVLPSGRPTNVVLTAASLASKSTGVSITMSGSITGLPSVGTLTITGSGRGDLHARTFELNATFQGGPAGLNGLQETVLYAGSHIYEWSPPFSTYFPGKHWIEIPFVKASGNQSLGGDPAAQLELLAQQGNTVRATGAATINGVLTEGYHVKFNATEMPRELAREHLPPAFRQQATEGLRLLHGLSLGVWVSGKQLVQMTERVQMSLLGSPVTATLTYNFQYTGTPVHIAAPTSGLVSYSSLVQVLRSQSGV